LGTTLNARYEWDCFEEKKARTFLAWSWSSDAVVIGVALEENLEGNKHVYIEVLII
jgi:hypothetical protein